MKRSFALLLFCLLFQQIKADSLDLKIGQMIMIGMQGKSVSTNSSIYKYVKSGTVGGVLLFAYNVSPSHSKNTLKRLTSTLQSAASIPLLISIDQEGGKVARLKSKYGYPYMPSARSVGLKNDNAYTRSVATTMATTLAQVGISLNYAPVLDVHNSSCPVIGKLQRSFSSDPNIIGKIAGMYVDAHRNNGVLTALKHFPGHGNSRSDSHLGIADVSRYWKRSELIPYRQLIEADKADMIMTAHIINTQLDPSRRPATLSKPIITGVLRNQLGYDGVVVTDDMQMGAIAKHYGFKESIRKAIEAGVDILMFSNNIPGASKYSAENVHRTIRSLVETGAISKERINESYKRILRMKKAQ